MCDDEYIQCVQTAKYRIKKKIACPTLKDNGCRVASSVVARANEVRGH